MSPKTISTSLGSTVNLGGNCLLHSQHASQFDRDTPVLVVLAAGKGTRFGQEPKCIQPIGGLPLARHSINAFGRLRSAKSICIVGYQADRVSAALGTDNLHVVSQDPTGGTAFAAYETFSVPGLSESNPVLVVTMGDRMVPAAVFDDLLATHMRDDEADLTLLTAIYEPPGNHGKGRIIRDSSGAIVRILEQPDIERITDNSRREQLLAQTEGNCPLYAIRAATLKHHLARLNRDNAQGQFYFTDIVAAIAGQGGTIRSVTVSPQEPSYDLLCADVTRREDLHRLEEAFQRYTSTRNGTPREANRTTSCVAIAAELISQNRPVGQVASIANQLEELLRQENAPELAPDRPVAIGISGGRLRIAFMHPDMSRFFGPAWQMPIGAADENGREQVVVMMQPAHDGQIRLHPTNPAFREKCDSIPADLECMFPGKEINDSHLYEAFGTSMAQQVLQLLGYVDDAQQRKQNGAPAAGESLQVSANMRRPFSLVCNALASFRTVRDGPVGRRVQTNLGRENFRGLRILSTGDIPQGGFSSSSAVTVATQNALNSLYDLGMKAEQLIDLACQAEFGTGVKAGALDQATEQTGNANQGTLISSNPREDYRIIRPFRVPAGRFRVLFPYSVDRDQEAWRWSAGFYASSTKQSRLTTVEMRKMTGKAAEIAAILTRLSLTRDFFQDIEADLVEMGSLSLSTAGHVRDVLKEIPLRATQDQLRGSLEEAADWYIGQLIDHGAVAKDEAETSGRRTLQSLLEGWRDPTLARQDSGGDLREEVGAPLRAMVGYLYGEVVKNCYLMHHPQDWIECVTQSQRGDRCFEIDCQRLPSKEEMMCQQDWEASASRQKLMERWLERFGARPFDFNAGLDDRSLADDSNGNLRDIPGTNFFRGLALIDLAEAMLQRAFGDSAVAVRVNGAGQGDYFQVHVDTKLADPEEVKDFIRIAFYRRFSLSPPIDFVEPHPGGGAASVKLDRYDQLPSLIAALRRKS